MLTDLDRQIKTLERNIMRLKESPNWPSTPEWKQIILWEQEAQLEEILEQKKGSLMNEEVNQKVDGLVEYPEAKAAEGEARKEVNQEVTTKVEDKQPQ